MHPLLRVVFCSALVTAALPAQRDQATFKVDRWTSVIDYGQPRYGKHSLADLPVGQAWRLGQNEATTWRTDLPVLAGDTLLAPGHYRTRIEHNPSGFYLHAQEAEAAMGGGHPVTMKGELGEGEPSAKLAISWQDAKAQKDDTPNRGTEIHVRFGPHHLVVPVTVIAAKPVSGVRGFDLLAFAVPSDVLDARLKAGQPTVVASLLPRRKVPRGQPELFNLVLERERARLLPAMQAPTESFGFGEVKPPDPRWSGDVGLTWDAAQGKVEYFTIKEAATAKGKLELSFAFGERTGNLVVEPLTKPRDS